MRTMAKATTAAVSLDTAFTGELAGWQNGEVHLLRRPVRP
jgi:hypothetical protein